MGRAPKPEKKSAPPKGIYTDTHCHLLPGVDDGAADWPESRICLEIARREKIGRILVTPHINPYRYPNRPEALRDAFEEWKEKAKALGIRLHLGCEAYYHAEIGDAWDRGELLPMDESGRFLLVELPLSMMPPRISETFYRLRLAGAEPVLAHPERYPFVQRDPLVLGDLARQEIPFLLTTYSLAGFFGSGIQKTSFALLERGWGTLVSSDAHSPHARTPMFREAVRILNRRYGYRAARLLCIENPNRILDGLSPLPVECRHRRRLLRR